MKRKHVSFFIVFIIVLMALLVLRYFINRGLETSVTETVIKESVLTSGEAIIEEEEDLFFGFSDKNYRVETFKVKSGQVFSNIINNYGVSIEESIELANKAKPVFNVKYLNAGKPYNVIYPKSCDIDRIAAFVYEINQVVYVVFDIENDTIYKARRPTSERQMEAKGVIDNSLYVTLRDAGLSPLLAIEMANVYAWTIDFYRLQKGDEFKVIYEESFVEDKSIGISKIIACEFTHFGEPFFAFYYDEGETGDYFDEKGGSLRKAFLKAPLKFGTITSKYTLRRKHPVTGKVKPHFGTDYAAPTGTPILSTGDGVVIEARYKKNNGNYVKIRHNSTYTTQYLHMSKIRPGIKIGVKVKQGGIIGYVGSTGLATGPHVCYRFWKNGQQVNPLRQKLPASKPINEDMMVPFKAFIEPLQSKLKNL